MNPIVTAFRAMVSHPSRNQPMVKLCNGRFITAAEASCVTLLACNLKRGAIAQELGLSRRTVETHLDRASKRSGVSGGVALTHLAIASGWVKAGDFEP